MIIFSKKERISMRIQGAVDIKDHTTCLKNSKTNDNPNFGQLYIYDNWEAVIISAQTVK